MPQAAQTPPPSPHGEPAFPDDVFFHYEANLFVDNGQLSGAPVIVEDHPTYFNLMGCIERESEMGALVTDFSLVKCGDLHKANGGYLVLRRRLDLGAPGEGEGLVALGAARLGNTRLIDNLEF